MERVGRQLPPNTSFLAPFVYRMSDRVVMTCSLLLLWEEVLEEPPLMVAVVVVAAVLAVWLRPRLRMSPSLTV